MNVAVLVSTYNRPKALDLVLQGLSVQSYAPQQIVIGDDGSAPETTRVIESWKLKGLPIEHCWHEDMGFRKTIIMNEGIRRVKADYVIFIDGDCVPFKSFVRDHVSYRESGHILAGGRILASQPLTEELELRERDFFRISILGWWVLRLKKQINRWLPLIRLPDGKWRKQQARKWELVRGCNFSVDLKALKAVNGFDETLDGWGMEDSDLAVRLINSGLKVKTLRYAAPQLHLWHKEEDRSRLKRNIEFLNETINTKRIRALKGLSQ